MSLLQTCTPYIKSLLYKLIQPENPRKAKPSDHLIPVAYPISCETGSVTREYHKKTVRPLPESGIIVFGQGLASEKWKELANQIYPNENV